MISQRRARILLANPEKANEQESTFLSALPGEWLKDRASGAAPKISKGPSRQIQKHEICKGPNSDYYARSWEIS